MTESFLHYIWQLQYFNKNDLQTTSGEVLQIFNPGNKNSDAGPDFSNSRIRIGKLEWRGSIEIHIKASGWNDHQHSLDDSYEKVVLHVVWENNKPVERNDGTRMPTLELKNRIDLNLWKKYKNLSSSIEPIPCAAHWPLVPSLHQRSMLDRVLMQRLEAKATVVHELLIKNNNDWEQVCYQLLSRNFGFKINAEPMFRLAQTMPHKILLKHVDKPVQVEALLFGMSGFLDEADLDDYARLLLREYDLLRKKYNLGDRQMNPAQWKFLRLRPANFPTVRIAQLAALLSQQRNLFSKILMLTSYRQASQLLDTEQSEYWKNHYQIGKRSKIAVAPLGEPSIQNIIINTVIPLLIAYGKIHDEQSYIDLAVDLLHHIPAENNKIIRQWLEVGCEIKTSFDSQAMLELYNNFCMKRRCLDCTIGAYLVKS